MNRLLRLAESDLANARDNLFRARNAAKHCNSQGAWGASGKTLTQIIAGYEEWEREALEAVEQAKRWGGQ